MMPTRAAYLELQDRALRHGTALARYASGIGRRGQTQLREVLRGRLTDRIAGALARVRSRGFDVGTESRAGLREGLERFDRGLRESLSDVMATARTELRGLADQEGDHEKALLLALLGVGIAGASRADLRRPVVAAHIAGETLTQQIRSFGANVTAGVRREIATGLATGATTEQILAALTGTTRSAGLFDRAEESLAQRLETVALGVAAQAREEVYKASDGVSRVLWIATLDGRVCPRCAALHGRRFAVGDGPRPPLHPRCRCVTTPAGTGADVVAIDFGAWLRRQPTATQNDILGATRARLFRTGKAELSRFVAGNRVLTLAELRARGVETDPYPNTPSVFR